MNKKTPLRPRLLQALALVVCSAVSFMNFAALSAFNTVFSPTTIGVGSTSTLTYTIDNSASTTSLSALSLSNTLPAGMTISSPSFVSTTCINGTYSAIPGANTITLYDYRLSAGASCTLQVDITSAIPGSYTNTTETLTTSAGNAGTASATLTVDGDRPGFSMAFTPATITPGNVSRLTYTIDNSFNGSDTNFLDFFHSLPSGLTVSGQPNVLNTCSGTFLAEPTSSRLSLSSGGVSTGASCTVSVGVTANASGSYQTKSGDLLQYSYNSSGPASGKLMVQNTFMGMAFPNNSLAGGLASLTFTINNLDRHNTAQDINFSNDLNATLIGLSATALPDNDFCGVGSTITGSSTLTIAGVNLPSGDSCSFEVTVLIPSHAAAGSYTNTSSSINLTLGSPTTKSAVSSTLVITKAPVVSATFIDDPVSSGDDVTLRYVITNTDDNTQATSISFTESINDAYTGMVVKTLPNANSCGTGSTFLYNSDNGERHYINVSDANLSAGSSCTFDVILTTPLGGSTGTFPFTTSLINATINGEVVYGTPASDDLIVYGAPKLSLAINEEQIAPGGIVTLDLTLAYNESAPADITSIAFTLDLENALSGLTAITLPAGDICGTGSSITGSSTLIFEASSLSADSLCTFSVQLKIPDGANPGNITLTSSTVTGTTSGQDTSSSAAYDNVIIGGINLTKSFNGFALPGSIASLTYTLTNSADALAATDIRFTDHLSSVISSLAATSTPTIPCGASSLMTGTTNLIFAGGELLPGASCSFTVDIAIPAGDSAGIYNSVTSTVHSTVNGNNTESVAGTALLEIQSLTVLLSSTQSNPTASALIPVYIYFSREVVNFTIDDLSVSNATLSNFSGSGDTYQVDVSPDTDGTVTLELLAGKADDAVDLSVKNPDSNTLSLVYNNHLGVAVTLPTASSNTSDSGYTISGSSNITGTSIYLYGDTDDNGIADNNTVLATGFYDGSGWSLNAPLTLGNTNNYLLGWYDSVYQEILYIDVPTINQTTVFSPVISGTAAVFVAEDSVYTFEPTATDVNADDELTFTITGMPSWAGFSPVSGVLTGTPSNENVGVTGDIIITVEDGAGGTDSLPAFTITVNNTNDDPVIAGTPIETIAQESSYSFTPSVLDIDEGDTQTFSITGKPVWASFSALTGALTGTPGNDDVAIISNIIITVVDSGGSVDSLAAFSITVTNINDAPVFTSTPITAVAEDSNYSFTSSVIDVDIDDTQTFSITGKPDWASFSTLTGALTGTPDNDHVGVTSNIIITVVDGTGAAASMAPFSLTVNNTNDAPVISGTPVESVAEDSNYSFTPNVIDVDAGDTKTFSITGKPSWASFSTTTGTLTGMPGNSDVGTFSAIAITVTDSANDASSLEAFSISVTNTNDIPIISGNNTANSIEDDGQLATGSLTITDVDNNESSFLLQTAINKTYGSFSIEENGSWNYDLNDGNTTVQSLPEGETITETINVFSADGTTHIITITITGVNGVATITGTSIGAATEDDGTEITGSLAIVDEDTGEDVFVAQIDSEGIYGFFSLTFTGTWSYQLDGSNLDVQILPEGEILTDSFTVISIDGTDNQVVTITITGINDIATITGTSIADIHEDNTTQITGRLSITDKDRDEAIFMVQTGVAGAYGIFNIDTQGNWSFNLDTDNTVVQQMSSGEQLTDSFTVMSIDDSDSQVITVNVFGVNDAPNAEHDEITIDIDVDNTYVFDVLANDSDIDGDTLYIVGVSTSLGTVSTDGESIMLTTQTGFVGQVALKYSITDGSNAFDETTVDIVITGALNETAPIITVPETVEVNAEGLYTKVDLSIATALNSQGYPVPISLVGGDTLFRPGNNLTYWQAIDPKTGLTTVVSQNVIVHPIISIGKDQIVVEGQKVSVDIILNGEAPTYPVVIALSLSGSVDENDYDIDTQEVTIESGTQASVLIDIFQDNVIEGNETLIVGLDGGNVSNITSQVITIVESNIASKVTLRSSQNAEYRQLITPDDGLVSIEAIVVDANDDNVSTQWLYDPVLNISEIDEYSLVLDPSELSSGIYSIGMTVIDDGEGNLSTTQTLYLEVLDSLVVLTVIDSDGDLIPDNEEGYGDSDQDGIPDFLDAIDKCNVMPQQVLTQNRFLVEGEPGVCLRKGNTLAANETGGLLLTHNDLDNSVSADEAALIVGGIFDFIVTGLPQAGQNYQIVLPQIQPIPAGAVYRKYSKSKGWGTFFEDVNNQLHSAEGELGYCPPPASTKWSAALKEGHWCVQLTIEDGGPNDDDGLANGTIVDPGGVSVWLTDNTMPVAQADIVTMKWGDSLVIAALENDSDADGDALSIGVATATFGSVTITADSQLEYQSKAGFIGLDTITYSLSDGNGGVDSSTVSITVYANEAPIAIDDRAETDDRTEIAINVLANDSDTDNDGLTVVSAMVDEGRVTINGNNTLTYTPDNGFDGTVTIFYTIDDGQGEQAIAQVFVTVQAYQNLTVNNKSKSGSMGLMIISLIGLALYRRRCKKSNSKKHFIHGTAALAVATSMSLAAAEPQWFITSSVGKSHVSGNSNIPSGIDISGSDVDKSGTSFSIGGGVRYDVYSFTASYDQLGDASSSYTGYTLDTALFHQTLGNSGPKLVEGISLQGQYTLWQAEGISASVGLGLLAWKLDYSSQQNESVIEVREDYIDLFYNLEVAYAITDKVQMSVKASRYNLSVNDINNIALGFTYHF